MGTIKRGMLEKRSGQVSYAVLSFGGFLGLGSDAYPTPWDARKYDTTLAGDRTNITAQQFKGAPQYQDDTWDWEDDERRRKVSDYYNTPWSEH